MKPDEGTKQRCYVCKRTKNTSCFSLKNSGKWKGHFRYDCKRCNAISSKRYAKETGYHRKHKYGIGLHEYENMIRTCGGRCELCGEFPKPNKMLHLDHNHKTRKVRGLLCPSCNLGLGLFKDNPATLQLAINYLLRRN